MELSELTKYLDQLLHISEIEDDSLNGLQVENSGHVKKIALAVDACESAFQKAREIGADFVLVHHGLFWGKPVAVTRMMYRRIQLLFECDIALYAAHLPLDMHSSLGNNAQVGEIFKWPVVEDFGEYHGSTIGKKIVFNEPVSFRKVLEDVKQKLNSNPLVWEFGPRDITQMGYISGGGVKMLQQAIEAGMDAYITGEPGHGSFWTAKEAGINVIFPGHYATETLGVKAVGEHIRSKFGLEVEFIDLPTGL
jgi:dinuclear metal center YbgI/SA1388 family protein